MVPTLNEEGNLVNTVREIVYGLKGYVDDYEIFIFDDGSTDQTPQIADRLAKKNTKIKVFHNRLNKGIGYCYRKGIELTRYEYYMYIPGDNQFPKEALVKIVKKIGKADIIIPFVTNMHIRPISRRILSSLFTYLVNLCFGLNIRYYNGTVIHRIDLIRNVIPQTDGFAYQAEILIKLIKSGANYTEVGYDMVERNAGSTSAFRLTSVKSVFKIILSLFWDIQILKKPPVSIQAKKYMISLRATS